jgi:hypothetical protein
MRGTKTVVGDFPLTIFIFSSPASSRGLPSWWLCTDSTSYHERSTKNCDRKPYLPIIRSQLISLCIAFKKLFGHLGLGRAQLGILAMDMPWYSPTCFTPTRPSVRHQPISPGDPDTEVTALGRELKEAAFPFDTSESFIPRVPSDTPSHEIETGTTGKVSFACKEHTKSSTGIKLEMVQDDDKSSKCIIPSTPSSSIKSISPIASDQETVDPLETPKQETQGPLEDPLATRQRGNTHTSRSFRALAALMATQPPAAAPPAQPAAAAAAAAPRPILFRSNKADTPWQHKYISGTTIGATICMEARKAFIPKPWQPPMTNVMVEMVNNFLDRIHSKHPKSTTTLLSCGLIAATSATYVYRPTQETRTTNKRSNP